MPSVFIAKDWISGDTCLFTITNMYERAQAKSIVGSMRKKFVARLIDEGFDIITDNKNIPEGTIYFIMDELAVCDKTSDIGVFKKAFDEKMFAAGGEKLNYPRSVSPEEFFANPFLPVVFKHEGTNAGKDKFLIETMEQVSKIEQFYLKYGRISPYKEAFSCSIFQQYIETPTNYKTYMRVLMSASGEVMGASLKFSMAIRENRPAMGVFENHFWDQKSPYYLNSKGLFGYYSGGGNISFSQPRYSTDKQAILQAHGIDPNHPTVPDEVLEVTSNIAIKRNDALGIISGFDFIQNVEDGKWYYLENQAFPAIDEWADAKGIKLPARGGVPRYLKYLEVEMEARYAALMMCVEKRKTDSNSLIKG